MNICRLCDISNYGIVYNIRKLDFDRLEDNSKTFVKVIVTT